MSEQPPRPIIGGLLSRLNPLRLQAEQIRRDFYRFVRESWHLIEPGKTFRDNWHIGAMVEHLTAVTFCEIRDLVINVPPRSSKSTIVSVMWPAWTWIILPETQWMCASYALHLSSRDSIKCRRLIESHWYQERFGEAYRLTTDQNTKLKFENDKSGYRLALSVGGGGAMGQGSDIQVIDDAHDPTDVHSDVQRQSVLDWYDEVMTLRMNDMATGRRVVIAQRVHHLDLCGHVLKQKGVVHLNIPMEFVPEKRCKTILGWSDPRSKEGELLDPIRFPRIHVDNIKSRLGRYAASAQLQQDPTPEEGGIFRKQDWRRWPYDVPPEETELTISVYDTAFETKQESDYCARTTWGVFPRTFALENGREVERMCVVLLERMKKRMTFPELREEAMRHEREFKPDRTIIENKASGHSLAQEFLRAGLTVTRFNPGMRDKGARAQIASLVLEQGCVFYMNRNWAEEVIETCARFPNDDNDDLVDTCVMAWLWLRKGLRVEFPRDMEEDDDAPMPKGAKFITQRGNRGYGG